MNAVQSTRDYDLFKLIVALGLLALFIFLMFKVVPHKPAEIAIARTTIPDSEAASPGAQVPTISATTPPADAPTTGFPEFPVSSNELILEPVKKQLLAPDGSLVYVLDQVGQAWIPAIPDDMRPSLPGQFELVGTGPNLWSIIEKENGDPLFAWDVEAMQWKKTTEGEVIERDAVCPLALPPRLQVGKSAVVMTNLNMRSSPGIQDNWLLTNITGTKLQVIDGPVCTPYQNGAFLWWRVMNPEGLSGWSAEAQLQGNFYYLEPIP